MKHFSLYIIFFLSIGTIQAQKSNTPLTPIIDSVSVADPNTGHVYISWFPSDSADGYRIYRSINMIWQQVADVPAPATSYLDMNAAANFHPELYRMAAYRIVHDTLYLSVITDSSLYHNTIYVFPYQDSINCHFAIRLNWNKYVNWPEGVKEYKIFISENSSPWSLLATVSGNTSQYYHTNINDNTQYCYMIRAISDSGKTSTSNKTCFYTNLPNLPQFINADYATVADNSIQLSFTLDTSATICHYQLLRSTDSVHFSIITSYNQCGSNHYSYTDYNVDIHQRYYYRLIALDQCGNERIKSNLACNIVLNVSSSDEIQNHLNWNSYHTWLGGVDSIYIYRILEESQTTLIYKQQTTDSTYIDDMSTLVLQSWMISGKFCYIVELVEGDGNIYGIKGRSTSNMECANQMPRVFIPNTFCPSGDSLNAIFKPSVIFIDKSKYTFKVFDRWGGVIFQTNDPLKGWDGKENGNNAAEGMYTYYILYQSMDGQRKERAGRFFLLNP